MVRWISSGIKKRPGSDPSAVHQVAELAQTHLLEPLADHHPQHEHRALQSSAPAVMIVMFPSQDCSGEPSFMYSYILPASVNLASCIPVTWPAAGNFYSKSTCNADGLIMKLYSHMSCNEGSHFGLKFDRIVDSTNLIKMKAGTCFGATLDEVVHHFKLLGHASTTFPTCQGACATEEEQRADRNEELCKGTPGLWLPDLCETHSFKKKCCRTCSRVFQNVTNHNGRIAADRKNTTVRQTADQEAERIVAHLLEGT